MRRPCSDCGYAGGQRLLSQADRVFYAGPPSEVYHTDFGSVENSSVLDTSRRHRVAIARTAGSRRIRSSRSQEAF